MTREDEVLAQLRQWRTQRADAGDLSFNDVRNSVLQRLARATSRQAVIEALPPAAQRYTDEVVEILTLRRQNPGDRLPPSAAATNRDQRQSRETSTSGASASAPPPGSAPQGGSVPGRSAQVPLQPPQTPGSGSVPATGPEGPPGDRPGEFDLADLMFCETEFTGADGSTPAKLDAPIRDGILVLRWRAEPSQDGQVTVYRVVSHESSFPLLPEHGQPVVVTADTHAVDPQPFTSGARFLQVWAYRGPTVQEASSEQPVLVAQTKVIGNVRQLVWTLSARQVSAEWEAPRRAEAVHVVRVPGDHPDVRAALHDPTFRLLPEYDHLHGFVDENVQPGEVYHYLVSSVVRVGQNQETSSPVMKTVEVPLQPVPVTDLSARLREDGRLDLRWTPPAAGTVDIYSSHRPPPQLLSEREQAAAELHQYLAADTRVPGAARRSVDEHAKIGVEWIGDADRIWFTPVTMTGDRVRAGVTTSVVRVRVPTDLQLVERVDTQLLKFGWPEGAAVVRARTGPRDVDQPATEPLRDMSQEEWRRLGGMEVRGLNPSGCRVELSGVAVDGQGQETESPSARVDYPGLVQVHYRVERLRRLRQLTAVLVELMAPQGRLDVEGIGFFAVHHPDRLPLHPQDGVQVEFVEHPEPLQGPIRLLRAPRLVRLDPQPGSNLWRLVLDPRLGGYFRLFVAVNPNASEVVPVALLDPPIAELRLS